MPKSESAMAATLSVLIVWVVVLLPLSCSCEEGEWSINGLRLSAAEQRWIQETRSIKVAGPRAFPPFHYYDGNGVLQGISADYLFAIMDQLGLVVEIQNQLPWAEVLKRIENKTIDLIPCIARTRERERYIDFSSAYLSFPLVIVSRVEAPFIGGIQDLHGKKLAVIRKNATLDWLNRDQIRYEPFYVDTPVHKLEAVALGTVDAGIENLAAATYLIQRHGLANLKIAAPTPYGNYDLYMGVCKGLPHLLGIVNKVLGEISPEAHMQTRSKWLSVRYEHGIQKSDLVKWVLGTMGAAVVIIALILAWNQRVRRKSDKRKALIQELEEALAEIKTLRGIVPICSGCKKIRDDKGYWNLLEAFIEEHSEATFSHGLCPDCSETLYGDQDWYRRRADEEETS